MTSLIFAVVLAASVLWVALRGEKDEKLTLGANLLAASLTAALCAVRLLQANL